MNAASEGFWLIYDGDCPVCRSTAHAISIRKQYGSMTLVDARAAPDHLICRKASEMRLDLDEGMVIFADGEVYHGAGAISFLARFGDPGHLLTKMSKAVNRSSRFSARAYGLLRGLRNILLRLRGIGRIDNLHKS